MISGIALQTDMFYILPEHHFVKNLSSTHPNEAADVSHASLPEESGGPRGHIRLVHLRLFRILERLEIFFSRYLNIKCWAWDISCLSVYVWIRILNESEGNLSAHVAEAVAAAAVAFPLAVAGVFLLAATAIVG